VSNDNHHHRGGFFTPPGQEDNPPPERLKRTRIQHMAWEFENIDDFLESYDRIRNLGIEPVACWCHYVSFSMYYKDPDGNTCELTPQGFTDVAKGVEYARSPAWAANPNGTLFDPPKLAVARSEGAELDDLRERAFAGEFKPDVEPEWTAAW